MKVDISVPAQGLKASLWKATKLYRCWYRKLRA